jgi:hypothetical protein
MALGLNSSPLRQAAVLKGDSWGGWGRLGALAMEGQPQAGPPPLPPISR